MDASPDVLFLGDTHGNTGFSVAAIELAAKLGCEHIVQLGDFGIWDHTPRGVAFLDAVQEALERAGVDLVFVRGNHEFAKAREDQPPGLLDRPVDGDGWRRIRPRILHAPDGHIWEWRGVTFLAAGGAHSIDAWPMFGGIWGFHPQREPGTGWWPEEVISDEQVERTVETLARHGRVDVVVSHDCPAGVQIPGIGGYPHGDANRARLATIVDAARPQLVVCGHYHRRHSATLGRARVEILASDQQRRGNYLLARLDPFELIVEASQGS